METVFGKLMKDISTDVDEEITRFLNWYWKDHKLQAYGNLACQSLYVLWIMLHDEAFKEMKTEEQNIMKWCALLHSIGKSGWPIIESEDYSYAFTSALIFIDVAIRMKLVDLSAKDLDKNISDTKRLL